MNERIHPLNVETVCSLEFQLGILKNIEREMPRAKRKNRPNWLVVQDYILGNTSKGGSTSCHQYCHYLGVDPDGHTFHREEK